VGNKGVLFIESDLDDGTILLRPGHDVEITGRLGAAVQIKGAE
jgi:hypothetical protein